MKTKLLVLLLLAGTSMFAATHFSIGVGIGGGYPYYYGPRYYAPAPVYYYQPYPVYSYPAYSYYYSSYPRYVYRDRYYVRRSYGGTVRVNRGRGRGWGRGHWR